MQENVTFFIPACHRYRMNAEQYKKEILPLREKLLNYAKKLLSDTEEAEDIVQEVLLKLWYIREDLGKYGNIPGLSMQMTKNLCINKLNETGRNHISIETQSILFTDDSTPLQKLEERDKVDNVLKIIDRLPPLQQLILRMKHLEEYETEEIAEITGTSVESVRMNLSRARRKVKELFLKTER